MHLCTGPSLDHEPLDCLISKFQHSEPRISGRALCRSSKTMMSPIGTGWASCDLSSLPHTQRLAGHPVLREDVRAQGGGCGWVASIDRKGDLLLSLHHPEELPEHVCAVSSLGLRLMVVSQQPAPLSPFLCFSSILLSLKAQPWCLPLPEPHLP